MGGPLPPVKRVNSVGLEFTGRAGYAAIEMVMCDMLRVPVMAVYGVELVTAHQVVIKFMTEEVYHDFLRRYEGRSLSLPGGAGSVSISDRSGALTYVSVHGAPLEFPEDVLRRYFQRFGAVISVRVNTLSSGRYAGRRTNVRTLGMRLRSDIPSSVRLLGYYVRVYYARQPRTCFWCGLLGHQAAGCDAAPIAQVNLFREEDFPLLPLDEDSGGEEVRVPFVAEAPPESPDIPPVVIDPPPDVAVPSDATPAPVAVAPVDLPVAPCEASPCAHPTSAAAPGPASSPRVPSVLGAGVAVGAPDVCGPVSPMVEAAAVLRRASVRPASGARVSESASGSDDLRPVPKRSRRSSSAWADVGEFSDCGSSGVDGVVPDASLAPKLVVAEVHVSADVGACVSGVPDVSSPPGATPRWGVVASAARDGGGEGVGRGLVVTLWKDVRSSVSRRSSGGVPVDVGAPVVVPSVRLPPLRMSVGDLGTVLPESVMPLGHWARIALLPICEEALDFQGGAVPLVWERVPITRIRSDTIWVPCLRVFVANVPDDMASPVDGIRSLAARGSRRARLPCQLLLVIEWRRVWFVGRCARWPEDPAAGGMVVGGVSRVQWIDTACLDFSGAVDWPLVEIAIIDVLHVDVLDLLGLKKLSPTRAAVSFNSSLLYREFVARWDARTVPIPASAVSVEFSDPWGAVQYVSIHGVPGQTRTCSRCGAEGHVAAGCEAPHAEAPSVFLEGDFPCLSEHGASSAPTRSVLVPGVVPAAVSAGAPSDPDLSGPGMSAAPVSSVDLVAPASGLRRLVVAEVHPRPVASVGALDAAVGVVPDSPADDRLLPGAAGVVVGEPSPLPPAPTLASAPPSASSSSPSSPSVVSSLSGPSSPVPALSSVLDASSVLKCALPPAEPAHSPFPVPGRARVVGVVVGEPSPLLSASATSSPSADSSLSYAY
ncbi:uncharacterized protein [Procambarus clarkii]|uniref:uncharacterized protein n=1 Tax=Procambarus clarkii TaxID=6728 RepID=UPI003743810A